MRASRHRKNQAIITYMQAYDALMTERLDVAQAEVNRLLDLAENNTTRILAARIAAARGSPTVAILYLKQNLKQRRR